MQGMDTSTAPDFVRYETPAAAHKLAGLTCTGFGATARKTAACGPRVLGCYASVYVSAGSGWVETSAIAGRQGVSAGTLMWLFPGVAHAYAPHREGWTEQWVMFDGPVARAFERVGFLSPARPVQDVAAAPEIAALFDRMRADCDVGGPLIALLGAALVYRLIVVAQGLEGRREGAGGPSCDVQLALARLEERALGPLDLAAIARESNMGYSTLRRRLKQSTGYSPKEYVLRLRLDRAKELLSRGKESVADIAHLVGFDDPYYFSRLFRAKEGVTPTFFRAQQQVGAQQRPDSPS